MAALSIDWKARPMSSARVTGGMFILYGGIARGGDATISDPNNQDNATEFVFLRVEFIGMEMA